MYTEQHTSGMDAAAMMRLPIPFPFCFRTVLR